MSQIRLDLHCPYCGKNFDLEVEENATEDDLIEECPLCGHPVDIRLTLDAEGRVTGARIERDDGDPDT